MDRLALVRGVRQGKSAPTAKSSFNERELGARQRKCSIEEETRSCHIQTGEYYKEWGGDMHGGGTLGDGT